MDKQSGVKGFTLLEVLVALAVIAIAVTLVIQLFSVNLRTIAVSRDMTQAAARADSRIRGVLSGDSLIEQAWNENTEDGYRFDISVSEIMKERTADLSVKLMEVVLTTHWASGMKEKSLTLKSMKMVDRIQKTERQPAL